MFDAYRNRLSNAGGSNRGYVSRSSRMTKEVVFEDGQSYKEVYINGKKYDARIYSDVADTVKNGNGNFKIEFREGDLFYPGTYVQIENVFGTYEYWLIVDVLDDLVFPKSLIKKCNYNLKWKNAAGKIIGRWVAFDDSYKLYDAVRNYAYNTNLPEGSVVIMLPYDKETAALKLDKRFIIDAPDFVGTPDTYSITNRSVVSRLYDDEHGVIKLSLSQDQFNHETDNAEAMIADYYAVPNIVSSDIETPVYPTPQLNLKITHKGQNRIVMGTTYKEYKLEFSNSNGESIDCIGTWEVNILPEFSDLITYEIDGNILRIKSVFNENLESYKFRVVGYSDDKTVSAETYIKVVSGI